MNLQKDRKNLDFLRCGCYNSPVVWSSTQAGRRGVTRNLVGRESVARVRIPAAPPKKSHPKLGWDFFDGKAGFERAAPVRRLGQKQSGGLFLARSRILPSPDAVRRTVDGEGIRSIFLKCAAGAKIPYPIGVWDLSVSKKRIQGSPGGELSAKLTEGWTVGY